MLWVVDGSPIGYVVLVMDGWQNEPSRKVAAWNVLEEKNMRFRLMHLVVFPPQALKQRTISNENSAQPSLR
jgi:hypothetical protein